MNKCDECKHKDNCTCVPYGCECFELDLEEHDKQVRAEVIEEAMENIIPTLCELDVDQDSIDYCVKCFEQLKE